MSAWRYVAWDDPAPLPCQACGQAPGTVAVYEGRVWRLTLCAACARLHQEGHALQLDLFEEEDARGDP